ncbi:hypothetical protein GCM10009846_22220 [Agrococcus versicolor]|uniref:N-acetyltransferase domain-containing protein n=1 Tax=Agrococcus versicolor TaxID=501482 RepID=A0ABN3AU06_9MICO
MAGEDARLATGGDARDVARLLHEARAERATPAPRAEVLAERLAALLEREDTFAIVAGTPSIAVGLVTLRPNVWSGTIAVLDEVFVAVDARRAGVGSAVLALVVAEAARRGATVLATEVGEADVDPQRFLERHGLVIVDPATDDRTLAVRRSIR